MLFEGEVKAVIELASFDHFNEIHLTFLDQLTESIGIVLNTIAANMRTEELLKQSQSLTEELQTQQEELTETNTRLEQQARSLQESEELLRKQQDELQQTNEELEEKAQLLAGQKAEVERKNREVEQAKLALEEKAEQLALTSKYKSEFLANMSHELRTPLNSLLILSQMLSENADGNLTAKQVEFAQTIHAPGSDLLALINDILDLSKIESGTMAVDVTRGAVRRPAEVRRADLPPGGRPQGPRVRRRARPGPAARAPDRRQAAAAGAQEPAVQRLQVHRAGQRRAQGRARRPAAGAPTTRCSTRANAVVAFSVTDTGIGIPADKQKIIFEAFQQADTGTSRKYGGTGLGLSISREIARLLGGEIRVESTPGEGSTFTLYLPLIYPHAAGPGSIGRADGLGRRARPNWPSRPPTASSRVMLAPVVERAIGDDRDAIEAGRPGPADRRGRPRLRPDPARPRPRSGFKGLVAQRADRALALAREYQPTRSRSTCGCPTWTAGPCSTGSSTTRPPATSRSTSSRSTRTGSAACGSGAFAFLKKPATKESLSDALTTLHEFVDRPVKRLLVVEDDETAAAEHRRADRRRRRADHRRRHRRRGARGAPDRPLRLHGARPGPART